jgi:CHASE2 domain-containing sensor protein
VIGRRGLWVLCAVLVVAKLTGLIAWSWVWVLAPLWLPYVLLLAFLITMSGTGSRRSRRRVRW